MERLMTQKTLEILQAEKQRLQGRVVEIGQDSEGGHDRAGWHDNAGIQHERNSLLASLAKIGDLDKISIIEPREEIQTVGIGNKVKVRFSGTSEDEFIYLLGPDDAVRRQDLPGKVISTLSPLGQILQGKNVDENVELKIPNRPSTYVRIVEITVGDF